MGSNAKNIAQYVVIIIVSSNVLGEKTLQTAIDSYDKVAETNQWQKWILQEM